MGDRNSSLTRVQPVFDELLDQWPDGDPWLSELWDMAALTRPGVTLSKPVGLGRLLASETPPGRAARQGTVYERAVAPPAAFLQWLLENPQKMKISDPKHFGAKSDQARHWRRKLFSDPGGARNPPAKKKDPRYAGIYRDMPGYSGMRPRRLRPMIVGVPPRVGAAYAGIGRRNCGSRLLIHQMAFKPRFPGVLGSLK